MKIQNTKRPTFHRISNSDENSDDSSGFRMDPTSNIHLVKVESSSSPMSKNSSVVGNPSLLPLGEARIDFTWTVNGSLSKRSVVQIKIFRNFFQTTQACKNSRAKNPLGFFWPNLIEPMPGSSVTKLLLSSNYKKCVEYKARLTPCFIN